MHNICNKGFIHDHEICAHAYSFAHLMNAPYFSHFHNQGEFVNNSKIFELNEHWINTRQNITTEHNINWSIDIVDFCSKDFNYGITIAIDDCIPRDIDDNPVTRVCHYADYNAHRWKEQKEIRLPLLQVYINGIPVAICVDPKNQTQFFYFNEQNQRYLKISCPAKTLSMGINIFKISSTPIKEYYKNLYTDRNKYFDFSEICFNKMQRYYGISVYAKDVIFQNDLFSAGSPDEIENYANLLWNEMRIYPKNIFQILNLDKMILFSSAGLINGSYDDREIFLNIADDISDSQKITALHHEVFHAIEKKLNCQHSESLAVIYGYLIHDKEYINNALSVNSDPELRSKINTINDMLFDIDESLPQLINQNTRNNLNKFRSRDVAYKSREKAIEIAHNKELQQMYCEQPYIQKHNNFHFVGIDGSGVSLCEKIFGGQPGINSDPITVVRNPIDICIIALEQNKNIQDTYAEWKTFYSQSLKAGHDYIRFEDIISMNKSRIAKVLQKWNAVIPSDWMNLINIDGIYRDWKSVTGIELILQDFINSDLAKYYGYERLSINT